MATSTKASGTQANDNAVGSTAWSDPTNAATSNDTRATVALSMLTVSNYLKFTNFSFAIPAGSTIDGITVSVERSALATNSIKDSAVRIVKAGSVLATPNKADTSITWPASDTAKTYGGATDKWGTTWTVANINAADFGFVIAAVGEVSGGTARIDYAEITVHYTAPSGKAGWQKRGWL